MFFAVKTFRVAYPVRPVCRSSYPVGGIGTRGTGEKQLEIDRRLVSKRITELRRSLANIDKRKLREIDGRRNLYKICLVGYTNAGKSTLMNSLTDAGVFVEDRLFATLDTRTKKWALDRGIEVLLSDTVGFVRHLPHHLVASFKATLEEAVNADLLLHVIDISNDEAFEQIQSVGTVLKQIGCDKKDMLLLLNKADVLGGRNLLESLKTVYPDAVCVSAKTGLNLEELTRTVLKKFTGAQVQVRITHRLGDGKMETFLRSNGLITDEHYTDTQVIFEATIGQNQLTALNRLKPQSLEIVQSGFGSGVD